LGLKTPVGKTPLGLKRQLTLEDIYSKGVLVEYTCKHTIGSKMKLLRQVSHTWLRISHVCERNLHVQNTSYK
jgi:hypothetical protein